MSDRVCAIIGIGPGNGESLARRFADEGYQVAMLSRTMSRLEQFEREIDGTHAFECDATDSESVKSALSAVADELGPVDVLVYNAGSGVWGDLESVSPEGLEQSWRVNTYGLFVAAQEVIGPMVDRGSGAIAVIGAGAAWRGRAGTIAFAAAKSSQRSVAQSLARRYGKDGVHVCYCVIDGMVDLESTRERMPDKSDDYFLDPDDIASVVYDVVHQPRSTWTFEFDVRPYCEEW
jgi:NADP-dependent 3-hydroxy acid dehydrogenase YdfG